jgi:hypothetical protein
MTTENSFYCRYCGDTFKLSKEEFKSYLAGEMEDPDTCDDCLFNLNNPVEDYFFSDADPGL